MSVSPVEIETRISNRAASAAASHAPQPLRISKARPNRTGARAAATLAS